MKKLSKKIDLDLKGLNNQTKAKIKNEVGEYIIGEILDRVATGKTPVSKEKNFKALDPAYAKAKKGGDRTPNLELEGDMLDALEFKRTKSGVEIGVFKSGEVPKADGHNNFSGKSKLPRRRFIPEANQKFKRDIEQGVKRIVQEYKTKAPEPKVQDVETIANQFGIQTQVTVDDLFDDEGLFSG